jgi:hypothetical protein
MNNDKSVFSIENFSMTASFSGPFLRIDSFVWLMNVSNSFESPETSLLRVNRACNSNRIIGRLSFHAYLMLMSRGKKKEKKLYLPAEQVPQ